MLTITDSTKINELLSRGVENIYPSRDFLEEKLKSGKQLTIYLGVDPTGPSLHLGHASKLIKLKQFQDLGHKVIFLIGSFTAMIGDPDKLSIRKPLTKEEVMANCVKYKEQASAILDFEGENPVEMKFNGDWLAKLSFEDIIKVASHFTVQQMLERDMFEKRMSEGRPIGLHEFLYPLMQGYDSVAMNVDGELGGNDQTFNMLAGRTLMKALTGKEKFVMAGKLLTDPNGKKMGKSEGNMVRLDDTAEEQFGKIMSWPDEQIVGGFEILTQEPMETVSSVMKRIATGENPRDIKLELAEAIVKMYYGETAAKSARQNFIDMFQKKEMPEDMPEFDFAGKNIVDVLVASKLVTSKTDARRNIEQNGVKVNGEVVTDVTLEVKSGDIILKGKRFYIKIK